jgi:hypothetical protein
MNLKSKSFLQIPYSEVLINGNGPVTTTLNMPGGKLVIFLTVLMFFMSLTAGTLASDQPDTSTHENLDTRWQPWIGSWRLISGDINTSESPMTEQYMLTITPEENGKSIIMKGYRDKEVLSEEKIIVDNMQHPLMSDNCTGWYMYSWSKTGKRLLLKSESGCSGDLKQLISGMSIIDDTGDWLDIQLLQNGTERAVAIRRYRDVDQASVTIGRANGVLTRISAGENFSIDEIIELSAKVEPEVLEAALLELRKPFPIDSQQLLRLADSKVPSQIVDLMVALSFPEKFKVERTTVSSVERPMAEMGYPVDIDDCRDHGYPFFPWYWGASIYSSCDYWHWGWGIGLGWYYTYWGRPYFNGEGHGVDVGRLIKGLGYTRVSPYNTGSAPDNAQPRYAQPRNAPAGQETESRPGSGSLSGMSSSGYSGGTSSSSSTGSSSGSSNKYPCASPGGYSSGYCD